MDGQRRKLISPGNVALTYTRDNAGRATSVADWQGRTTTFEYYPDGKRKRIANVNGTYADYAYDDDRRLVSVTDRKPDGTIFSQYTYTLDAVGNRVRLDEVIAALVIGGTPNDPPAGRSLPTGAGTPTDPPAGRALPGVSGVPDAGPASRLSAPLTASTLYSYDRLYRLTSENGPAGQFSYTYDAVGNRLTKTAPGGTTAYTYDRADRITSVGGISYSNDANGNLLARGAETFHYDQANRLTSYTKPNSSSQYAYDGDGKRTRRIVDGVQHTYLYDVKAAVPLLIDDGERRYVWRPTLAYTIRPDNSVESVYHTDGMDSARILTDASGAVTDIQRTDAFGALLAHDGTSTQPFALAGEQRDAENGLVYLRARMYDPSIGRFIQRDPLLTLFQRSLPLHRFVYAANSPLRYADPAGLDLGDVDPSEANSEISGDPEGENDQSSLDEEIEEEEEEESLSVPTGVQVTTDPSTSSPSGLLNAPDLDIDPYEDKYGDLQEEWDARANAERYSPQAQSREEHRSEQRAFNDAIRGLDPDQVEQVHEAIQDMKGPEGRASIEDIKAAREELFGPP